MYYAIFFSHLIYGCNVWGLTSEENLDKIEILQKKCVRILTFADFNSHTNQIFIDLGIIKVRDLISMNQLTLVFDFLNGQLPSDLMNLFSLSSDIHSTSLELNSALNNLLYIPRVKTSTYGIESLRYHCAKLWNSFFKTGLIKIDGVDYKLSDIKNSKKLKSVLKRHFLHSYTIEQAVIFF